MRIGKVINPGFKIITGSNLWGKVSLDAATVNTKIVINDPNFYLVPLKALCDIYLKVEGYNVVIKLSKRISFGMRNPKALCEENYA